MSDQGRPHCTCGCEYFYLYWFTVKLPEILELKNSFVRSECNVTGLSPFSVFFVWIVKLYTFGWVLCQFFFVTTPLRNAFMFLGNSSLFITKIQQDATKYQNFYYSILIWSSTCFGRHTAHHQEPKTALVASGFSYVENRWTCSCWTLSGTVCAWQRPPTNVQRPSTYEKPEAASAVLGSWWWAVCRPKHVELHINME
jgi:hypothetical protein